MHWVLTVALSGRRSTLMVIFLRGALMRCLHNTQGRQTTVRGAYSA